MIFVACALALACWPSVIQSDPLTCEQRLQPLAHLDPHHLEGKWALVAGSLSHLSYFERFKQRDSAAVNFSSNSSDTNISYTGSILVDDKCLYSSYNITLEGSSFTYDGTDKSNLTGNFVHTSCHDCLLMRVNVESGKREHLYLFSRRRELEQKEMEDFKGQVECLNMPPPAVMDPTKELCPEEKADDTAAQKAKETDGQND